VGRRPGAPLSAYWLGQAGFLLETDHLRILIDAYLSDTLAEKYRGKVFPHLRMMPPPVDPATLRDLDLVLATHGHTDHLDPGTLAPVAHHNPRCRFVVPASSAALAISRGVPKERLLPANAFAALELPGVRILPLPSAHEELTIDAAGRHLFLGYLLELCGVSLYHPGDCVPYPGLLENLSPHPVDLALLPVNGRDKERTLAGVLGNFTLGEAISLTKACGFGAVVGHHFGLFDFNTIDPAAARAELHLSQGLPPFLLAEVGVRYDLWPRTAEKGAPKGDEKG
jgi:L-ascorbate metabolism protein UlaG (beta-lactamase superfamily)